MNSVNDKRQQRYNFLATLFLYFISFVSIYYGYVWVAYGIIFLGSFIGLIPEWGNIKNILNKYFKKFYQLIILSISYIISIKYLNYSFKIESDYLTYSPWLISIIFQVSLFFSFIIAWVFISSVISVLIYFLFSFLPASWIEKINNYPFVRLSNKSISILIITLPLIVPLYYICNPLLNIALRIDAYTASNCGEIKPNTAYLRKNDKECYKFYPYFSFDNPSVISSIKGK
ncbi:hypothetical protein ACSLVK_16330 [Photorhabdus tasmaniensis]|uniref:hypothetical protein n=1 Tax=Photorhabdus tasmaniensis TaxID=1004159 RepID=UPI004042B302